MKLNVNSLGLLALACCMGSGCGSEITTPISVKASNAPATTVYVVQEVPNNFSAGAVLEFSATANGTVSPLRSLTVPSDMNFISAPTVDHKTGALYTAGVNGTLTSSIYQFPLGATGAPSPTRTLFMTGGNPGWMITDAAGNLYVASAAEIDVFAPSSTSAPVRVIKGNLTQLIEVDGIAVDSQGSIYVTNCYVGDGQVLVYAPGATGNVAPVRVMTGVGNANFLEPSGIAIDAADNLYVASSLDPSPDGAPTPIYKFAPGATTPSGIISGPATGLGGIGGIQFDDAGNLFVVTVLPQTTAAGTVNLPFIYTFAPGADGNVAPIRSFSSPQWTSLFYGQIGLY